MGEKRKNYLYERSYRHQPDITLICSHEPTRYTIHYDSLQESNKNRHHFVLLLFRQKCARGTNPLYFIVVTNLQKTPNTSIFSQEQTYKRHQSPMFLCRHCCDQGPKSRKKRETLKFYPSMEKPHRGWWTPWTICCRDIQQVTQMCDESHEDYNIMERFRSQQCTVKLFELASYGKQ